MQKVGFLTMFGCQIVDGQPTRGCSSPFEKSKVRPTVYLGNLQLLSFYYCFDNKTIENPGDFIIHFRFIIFSQVINRTACIFYGK